MSFPCNSCGVFAAPGKHLGSNAQAGNAVRILPVPRLKCFIAQIVWNPLRWRQTGCKAARGVR